jgi:hypothetical protein
MKKPPIAVTQKKTLDPFWKANVQKTGVETSLDDVLAMIGRLEAKIDLLLEESDIQFIEDEPDDADDGGWVTNRGN